MEKSIVKIFRHDPEGKVGDTFKEFEVIIKEKSMILEILMQIYDTQDSSLAFNHGCRAKSCGLCVVNVNGHPRYACISQISPNAKISPLNHLPLIKDLVFDREPDL